MDDDLRATLERIEKKLDDLALAVETTRAEAYSVRRILSVIAPRELDIGDAIRFGFIDHLTDETTREVGVTWASLLGPSAAPNAPVKSEVTVGLHLDGNQIHRAVMGEPPVT